MKKKEKQIIPNKEDAKFYSLDPSKPVAAEGYKSKFPLVLLLVAVFFCCIYVFIVIFGDNSEQALKLFFIICCVLLGIALVVFCGYHIRNFLVKKKIRAATITAATVTSAVEREFYTRDSDGDTHRRIRLSLTYVFYDKDGNLHTERFERKYNVAPSFFEGQQLIVAFDSKKCYILSKYTLLDDDGNAADNIQNEQTDKTYAQFTGEEVNFDESKYVPLGYDKRLYILGAFFSVFAIGWTAAALYEAFTASSDASVIFAVCFGIFAVVFWSMALYYLVIPFQAKRKYDAVTGRNPTCTRGQLIAESALYGNNASSKYACVYVDGNGVRQKFNVRAEVSKRLVRQGHTDVVVAYADGKAVALVRADMYRIRIR